VPLSGGARTVREQSVGRAFLSRTSAVCVCGVCVRVSCTWSVSLSLSMSMLDVVSRRFCTSPRALPVTTVARNGRSRAYRRALERSLSDGGCDGTRARSLALEREMSLARSYRPLSRWPSSSLPVSNDVLRRCFPACVRVRFRSVGLFGSIVRFGNSRVHTHRVLYQSAVCCSSSRLSMHSRSSRLAAARVGKRFQNSKKKR